MQPHSPSNRPIVRRGLARSGLPFALALSIAAFAAAGPARPASLSCANAAVPSEFAICNSESLQVLDEQLDAAYRKNVAAVSSKPERQNIARDQLSWTLKRNECDADVTCLALRYQERLADVESATSALAGASPAGSTREPTSLLGFAGQ